MSQARFPDKAGTPTRSTAGWQQKHPFKLEMLLDARACTPHIRCRGKFIATVHAANHAQLIHWRARALLHLEVSLKRANISASEKMHHIRAAMSGKADSYSRVVHKTAQLDDLRQSAYVCNVHSHGIEAAPCMCSSHKLHDQVLWQHSDRAPSSDGDRRVRHRRVVPSNIGTSRQA